MADEDQRDAREAHVAGGDRRTPKRAEGSADPRHEPVDGFLRSKSVRFLEAAPGCLALGCCLVCFGRLQRSLWFDFEALTCPEQPLALRLSRHLRSLPLPSTTSRAWKSTPSSVPSAEDRARGGQRMARLRGRR